VFAAILSAHGGELCFENIVRFNQERRRRKASGVICDHCLQGHQEHCTVPELCDCLCHR